MKHKLLTASAAFPLAMMLGGGAIYCLITAFSLPVEDPKLLLTVWALCALGGCVLFSIPRAGLPAVAASASEQRFIFKLLSARCSDFCAISYCTKKHIPAYVLFAISARRDSNPRPRPWQGRAPPTEPLAHL